MKDKSNKTRQEIVCALFTATCKVLIVQPFDLLRFRIQSNIKNVKIFDTYKRIIHKEGITTFLKGSNVTALSVFAASFIQFSVYQKFLEILVDKYFDDHVNRVKNLEIHQIIKLEWEHSSNKRLFKLDLNLYKEHMISKLSLLCGFAGFMSGIVLTISTLPLDNIRIKLQSINNVEKLKDSNALTPEYKSNGFRQQFINIYRNNGIKGFYIGFPISLLRECVASTLYFTTFEYLKNREKIKYNKIDISFYKKFLYGAFAGAINWLGTYPLDTVKTKIISDSINIKRERMYKGILDCFIKTYRCTGLYGFYNGFSLVLLRGMLVNGVTLSSFDFCRTHYIK